VVPGPIVTSQSSNSARSAGPAWPVKVISYVRDCTRVMPRSQLSHMCAKLARRPGLRHHQLMGDPGLRSLASDSCRTAEQFTEQALSISEHGRTAFEFVALLDRPGIWAARGQVRDALATIEAARGS
jgi:hypothetical protein